MLGRVTTTFLFLAGSLFSSNINAHGDENMIERLNPPNLRPPIHQSHIVVSNYPRTAYFRASPYDVDGNVVGENDFARQAEQMFKNVAIAMEELGASQENIIKITAYVVGFDFDVHQPLINEGFANDPADTPYPSATLVSVQGLGDKGIVFEVDVVVGLE